MQNNPLCWQPPVLIYPPPSHMYASSLRTRVLPLWTYTHELFMAILPLLFSPLPFLFFCLNRFGLDKTSLNVHNASANAQIH